MKCYCGSGFDFEKCCSPFIEGSSFPPTPEALMRSRYTAYCLALADYLLLTTHPKTRGYHRKSEILAWSMQNRWLQLEVIKAERDIVTFKAVYLDAHGERNEHIERSRFVKQHGKWYYLDGTFIN